MKPKQRQWLTETELAAATNVPVEILRAGVASGLFDGWTRTVDGEIQFMPATPHFIAWSSRLADEVIEGCLTMFEAARLLRRQAQCVPGVGASAR